MTATGSVEIKGNTKKIHRKQRKKIPKPGEEGYKTPTQLRNARKRRAKKNTKKRAGEISKTSGKLDIPNDPSIQYLSNPQKSPIVRQAKKYFESLNQVFDIHVGPIHGWRTVAKLAVRCNEEGHLVIGLFAPNSHRLICIPKSIVHHPSINETVQVLQTLCRSVPNLRPYNEETGEGHLRHVVMSVERSTGKVQLTLVWNGKLSDSNCQQGEGDVLVSLTKLLINNSEGTKRRRRRGRKGAVSSEGSQIPAHEKTIRLHSLWVHFNDLWKHSNAIFSHEPQSWKHFYGPEAITESLNLRGKGNQIQLNFPPQVFRQANLDAFEKIVDCIRLKVSNLFPTRKPSCLELYGGVGTIGLNIADLLSSLVSSDENPYNKKCFLLSSSSAKLSDAVEVSYEAKKATDMVHTGCFSKSDVVVVDPPRKGLEDSVLQALITFAEPKLLVYVSCGFQAFQRDSSRLLESEKWELNHAEGHIVFPGSDAIETVAFFTRKATKVS